MNRKTNESIGQGRGYSGLARVLAVLALLMTAATGAMARVYYAPSTDEVIILNDVYDYSKNGYSTHSAIAWGGQATTTTSNKKAGNPNNGGVSTSSTVSCYSVKGNGQGKNITLSITGVSKVIVYHESHASRYIELRDGSKTGNIIGSGQTNTYYTEVALTATNQYSIFLHGTSNGSDDQDFYVYAIKLIAAADPAPGPESAAPAAVTAAEINSDLYSGWKSIDEKLIKASELPGFQAVTENQAKSWTGVPSTGKVKLFYDFVADGQAKVVKFKNGVYDSSYEEEDLRCYDIYEDIVYNGDTKYFYTTGPAPAAVTGVTLLVTIENKDYVSFVSGSKTFDDKVTVTFSKTVKNYGDNYGWYSSGTGSLLTVAGTNGYTITSCKFYTQNGTAANGYTVEGESPSVYLYNGLVYTDDSKSVSIGSNGVTKIEVYGAAAVTGVTLPSTSSVTLGDAVALTAAVAPADATDKKVKWSVTSGSDKVKLYKDADCKTEVGTDATDALTVYAKGLAVGEATVKVESNADATKSATCAVTAKHGTYAVTMKDGVTDGDKWTAKAGQDGLYQAMPLKGVEGGTKPVELKYGGDLEVKRVTMRVLPAWKGDLSKLSATELESDGVTVLVKDGMTLTGTLSENYKITIADGATVTLDGVTINGTDDENYKWAGINCAGSATIVLKDGTENTVKGFHSDYPGIHVPSGATLTIQGNGTLTASSNGNAAGIGGGKALLCGSISIEGGTVTATGGGTAAGIGGGEAAACGSITIADGVTKVTATKGTGAPKSIGEGFGGYCGAVTIGGTVYYDGSAYQNDGATYLAQDEIEYPTPVAFAANEYNAAWWDGSKVVFIKKTADSTPTAVANSNTAVTWSDGWYTVAGEVTISGNVTLGADTYLILQDGAKLTINGQLNARNNQKNLYIYGQRKGDGKLNVISSSSSSSIEGEINKTVEIHGGEITAEGLLEGLSAGYIKVFSGKITATCSSNGFVGIGFMNSCDVYGGEIEATTNNFEGASRGISDGGNGGTFTVYGGKVKGTGSGIQIDPDNGSGFEGKVKSGTAGIKFYFSDNGTDWDEGTYYGTATAAPRKKYAKAE